MTRTPLRRRSVRELCRRPVDPMDPAVHGVVADIVTSVREGGEQRVGVLARQFGDLADGEPLYRSPVDLRAAWDGLDPEARAVLERTASRIRRFAEAQRAAVRDMEIPIPGGRAGHRVTPIERAGCYAPGGRYPLPSTVLMTAVTARVAGVTDVWVASPGADDTTLAAAHLAGADGVLVAGGAHAVAALAYGIGPVAPRDIIVGPGNKYVSAAKLLVSSHVATDLIAGPSELVVLADGSADPAYVAADLLAQAEHDPEAFPVLISIGEAFASRVASELSNQLARLPTRDVAEAALGNGGVVIVESLAEGVDACNLIAPEHLEVCLEDAPGVLDGLRHFGSLFLEARTAEVLGDYGAGPNHVLPTGGSARGRSGLSVFTFLRLQTWMEIEEGPEADGLIRDAAWLGRREGLAAHARAADARLTAGGEDRPS